jgi:N-acetylneuraminic acid mutarotase
VFTGGRIFLAGGLNGADSSLPSVFAINAARGAVRRAGAVPRPFHDAAAGVVGGRVMVFGGGTGQAFDLIQSFDPATDASRIEGAMPKPLSDLTSGQIGHEVYLVGGYDGLAPQRAIYATSDGTHFRQVATLPIGLRYPAVASFGSTLIIAGGEGVGGSSGRVLSFDPSTGAVRTIGHLPRALGHAMAFTLGNNVYVVGGRDSWGEALRGIEAIDPVTGAIRAAGRLPRPLADAAVVTVGQTAWLFGGWRGETVTDVLVATPVAPSEP